MCRRGCPRVTQSARTRGSPGDADVCPRIGGDVPPMTPLKGFTPPAARRPPQPPPCRRAVSPVLLCLRTVPPGRRCAKRSSLARPVVGGWQVDQDRLSRGGEARSAEGARVAGRQRNNSVKTSVHCFMSWGARKHSHRARRAMAGRSAERSVEIIGRGKVCGRGWWWLGGAAETTTPRSSRELVAEAAVSEALSGFRREELVPVDARRDDRAVSPDDPEVGESA